ncbi:MAG: thiamine phosphate synthase [Clostridia bacterium]|nr:thiamine phosphate synthase [Clostridia bacterium]
MKLCKNAMRLYAVTDRSWLNGKTLYEQVEEALKGGVTCVQLREKNLSEEEFFKEAVEIGELCRKYEIPFIINDNVEIAVKCKADGIHVGQSDMNAGEVKDIINSKMLLGVSASTVEEAVAAEKAGADYIGVGAVFSTSTKADACDVSFETLKEICESVSIPVVAIGGISEKNILELSDSGIDGVAVVSAIFASENIEKSCRNLLELSDMAAKTQIEGAIFDVDGTLLDSMDIWETVAIDYVKSKGKIPEKNLREVVRPMSLYQSSCYVKEHYEIEDSIEKIMDDINKIVEDFYFHEATAKNGVKEFLTKLKNKGVKMCVATATDKYLVEAALERNGILHFFEKIFTCTEAGSGKDEPHIFNLAREFLGTKLKNTYVFEDALYAAKTAVKAGFRLCGIYDKSEKETEKLEKISDIYLKSYNGDGGYFD